MTEFYEARIRAEWQDWSFGAHQAAARAAAAEDLIALRRQYTHLAEQDLRQLADSWRSESASGPYFTFTAAAGPHDVDRATGLERASVILSATFVKALFHELDDQAPAALAALLAEWSEQRRHAARASLRPTRVQPPRVALLLSGDDSRWPAASWDNLRTLDLEAPSFDGALLRWDSASALWLAEAPPQRTVL